MFEWLLDNVPASAEEPPAVCMGDARLVNAVIAGTTLDLRPAKDSTTTYGEYVDRKWARRWPAEEVWRVRKP